MKLSITPRAFITALILVMASLACFQESTPPAEPTSPPSTAAPAPPTATPLPTGEPTTPHATAPPANPDPNPTPETSTPPPTRAPWLHVTPTPDAYAQGHRPVTTGDNDAFLKSLEPKEAQCLRENLTQDLVEHTVTLVTSNASPDRRLLWLCLSDNAKNRIIVSKLAPETAGASPQAQACIAQMTAGTDPDLLWDAIHQQGHHPKTADTAANLAFAASSCLSEEPVAHWTDIGTLSTAMSAYLECLIGQIGDPHDSSTALRQQSGLPPANVIEQAWRYCLNND